ncbi:class I SAM-dependent methyltransferase [uncultured Shewanella sp.]|uniref:class I SAM-dependent methyltransferase n=1 Tax=uncultured Shewanella sp. TaxID=173975 RepID=UPI00260C3DF4|nr:class I SAM-dependent methyltransferase [uncultured Shewanella sp.]
MKKHLNLEQRKKLHGADYVNQYLTKSPKRLRELVDRMHIAPGSDVIDFGCGDALIIQYIKDFVNSYQGVDFSSTFIEVANRRKKAINANNVNFECDSIANFCKSHKESYDIGFALDLSEHVYDKEWQEIVDAMYQCLRPGGIIYLHTPNAGFFLERMKEHNFLIKQFPEHVAVRNAQSNHHFFSVAGFENINVKFIPHYNVLRLVHPLSCLPFVGKFFQARLFITAKKPLRKRKLGVAT